MDDDDDDDYDDDDYDDDDDEIMVDIVDVICIFVLFNEVYTFQVE